VEFGCEASQISYNVGCWRVHQSRGFPTGVLDCGDFTSKEKTVQILKRRFSMIAGSTVFLSISIGCTSNPPADKGLGASGSVWRQRQRLR
jgi:hypothetical protein